MKQSNVFSNATGWKPIRILKIKILLKQLREKKKKISGNKNLFNNLSLNSKRTVLFQQPIRKTIHEKLAFHYICISNNSNITRPMFQVIGYFKIIFWYIKR